MIALEILEAAKKVWDTAHSVPVKQIGDGGDYYLVVQGSTGDTVFEFAKNSMTHEDTWDEIMAGLAGDVIQSVLLVGKGKILSTSLDVLDIGFDRSLGTVTKELYMYYKYGSEYLGENEFWDYLTNWYDGYNIHDYVKVKGYKDPNTGEITYYKDNASGLYVFEDITATVYNDFLSVKQAVVNEVNATNLDTKIENTNGIFKVTLPTGEIIAEGDNTDNTIIGANKEDYLIGNGGIDTLIGNGGKDYLEGGAGSDTLVGGEGDDIYIANNGDSKCKMENGKWGQATL